MIGSIVFVLALAVAGFIFGKSVMRIRRNILLGKDVEINDNRSERWKTMALVALGQSKMVVRPVAGIMHIFIYIGFIIINAEVLEIIIDGIFGTHRIFAPFLGGVYDFLIGSFELLAGLVLLACMVFLVRRNVLKLARFHKKEMNGWPANDANLILVIEILLMTAFLTMNAADYSLQQMAIAAGADASEALAHYIQAGSFPVSGLLSPLFDGWSESALIAYERGAWWFHILGILAFLNYIPFSKHFHIFLAFPTTFYSNLKPKGQFENNATVMKEVKLMMDPDADPYAAPAEGEEEVEASFGAKDVRDLSWKNLMDAYSCTECGRCTSNCPANQTGKLLSPRKIMMDTRDRIEEVGRGIDKNGKDFTDEKTLLGDYISEEELWACTTCNACTDACPINIDPLAIIMELRRSLVMEESKAPESLVSMMTNVENNAAPWQFSQADRMNWVNED